MKKFKNLIKHIDLFGKPLFLNFDKNWNTFDTFCGGCSALALIILSIVYTGLLINVMVNNA